jgi:hypothetical protein
MNPPLRHRLAALVATTVAGLLIAASPAAAHPGHGASPAHTHAQGNEVLAGVLPILFVVAVAVVAAVLFLHGRAKDRG